jgi:hypothetical protein
MALERSMSQQIPTYIQPQYFLPVFAAAWFAITGLLAHMSGWARLAKRYRAERTEEGERFRFVSGSLWNRALPVNYGNCLFVTLNPIGIRLSILFPFRFQSPPLFVPWTDVVSVTQKRLLFLFRYVVIIVKEQWPHISLYGNAGAAAHRLYLSHLQARSNKPLQPIARETRSG